ncbi:MAG: Mur ligase family protein, partial [Gaiellaceae bacterium]
MKLPRRALVLGLARSGQSAALALARRGVPTVAADRAAHVETGRLAEAGVEVHPGNEEEALLDGVELLIKSPGVPGESPLAAAARSRGIPIWSEVELGFRLLRNPFVGVTGTNGKTTPSELLGALFRADGRPVAVAGNVGRSLTSFDGALERDAWIVCELSSFQLEGVEEFRADVAVLLNVTPDHLDRHTSFESYAAAKLRVFERQRARDVAVLCVDDAYVAALEDSDLPGEGRRVRVSGTELG